MRNKQTHVKIRGPKDKGQRVLRPLVVPTRPKGTRFYNEQGEDFEALCPILWAQQLEAAGNVDIVGNADPEHQEETKPAAESQPQRDRKPSKSDKGDK